MDSDDHLSNEMTSDGDGADGERVMMAIRGDYNRSDGMSTKKL